jgi:hypothetical protein
MSALLLPVGAQAFEITPNVSRVLSDPSYLPFGAQFYGSTEYSYGNTSSTTNNYLNTLTKTNSTPSNTIHQILEYGLTSDFTLRVSDSYEWLTSTTTDTAGNNTVTNSYGFDDSAFGATWRVLDAQDHGFNFDFIGSYAPNFISAQSATTTNNGNIARGGDTATLGSALSYKGEDFTLYLEYSATYLDNRAVVNPTTQVTTNSNSSWQYEFLISTQTRLSYDWSINLTFAQTYNDNVSNSYLNGNTLTTYTLVPGNVTDLLGALNFHVVPNRFVISAVYNHDFYTNGSSTFSTQPNSNTTTLNKGEDVFSGELRYVFN